MKRLPFLFAWLLIQMPLWAGPLWNGTVSGMRPAEVMEKFESAIVPTKPSSLKGHIAEKVRIPSHKYLDHYFMVHFYFVDGTLIQVTLELNDPGKRDETIQLVDLIAKDLSQTRGEPKQQTLDEAAMRTIRLTWDDLDPRVSIYAVTFGPPDGPSFGGFVNINFQTPEATKRLAEASPKNP